jgi:HEAT repeat protein
LRAAALVALARAEGTSSLPLLVDAMADPSKDVRIAAAVALGAVGSESAGLILRLKVRLGDRDPDVLSECLGGLLAVDPKANLSLVTEFLEPSNPAACEAAALALGKSRLPEGLDPLKGCLQRCHSPELRRQILLAIAILRRPSATDFGSWAQNGIGPLLTTVEVFGSASGVKATLCSRSPSHGLSDPIIYG